MKKNLIAIILVAICTISFSQKQFTEVFSMKFPLAVDSWFTTPDNSFVIAGNNSEICGIDAVNGKVAWTLNMKEKLGVKKAENWSYEEEGYLEIICKGDKKGEEKTYLVAEQTGEILSDVASLKQKRVRAGISLFELPKKSWQHKGMLSLDDPNVILTLEYESPSMNSSYDRGKKRPIGVSCSGEIDWTTTVQGSFVRSLCDNMVGSSAGFGGDFITIEANSDYVFVIYEGVSVLDIRTGKLLWETTFDYSAFDLGLMKAEMIIGRAPMPVSDNSGTYIADLSKDVRSIRKFDSRTGSILWESERLKKDAIITEMITMDDMLVVRFGGKVLVQTLITNANTGGQTCRSEMKEEGDFNLAAYDARTGKLVWEGSELKSLGDKFSMISNLITDGKNLYVASDRNLFALDPKTGNAVFKTDLSKKKIGDPVELFFLEGDLMIDAEEGLARASCSDGTIKYATSTGKNLGSFVEGNVFYVWTGKEPGDFNEFVRFNLQSGVIEGKGKDITTPYFSPDGNAFIMKDGSTLMRFSTI